MKSNLVHSYITGFKFDNIFGGQSDDYSRAIIHMKYLSPTMAQKWPWMKNKWQVSDHARTYGYFKTLKEAKAKAQELWPGCGFKTPEQFRKENGVQE